MRSIEEHRSHLEKLKSLDLEKTQFLEELLAELAKTQDELKQVNLDLISETEARRKWQEELKQSKEQEKEISFNKYAIVLIDGDPDGYIFTDFLSRSTHDQGEKAADHLHQAVQSYLRKVSDGHDDLKIVVNVYANVDGLARALVRDRRVDSVNDLRSFVTGFTNRLPLSNFIDVGHGKERADNKIKEVLKFHASSWQCKHILLGCHYDNGYIPFLGQFAADNRLSNRITLIEGSLPVRKKVHGFRTVQLDSVFGSGQRQAVQVPVKPLTPEQVYKFHSAKPERLGPVLKAGGRRMDKPLSVRSEVVKHFEKANLCHWLFLRGECREKCSRSHTHSDLTDEEFDALWLLARRGRCYKSRKFGYCDDERCIYGHS